MATISAWYPLGNCRADQTLQRERARINRSGHACSHKQTLFRYDSKLFKIASFSHVQGWQDAAKHPQEHGCSL